ncbi:cytochrome b/b6 domain-containing protein [Vreelandella rituensis]|uniref:Cytochrome B n=1 Tax=Vreelandella rituensis TaxID=2282306 RepID=A0A368U7N4_9GAMM|nr:cytochrome b/b6 domain-containing protein [Halomonas rituensis]RCV92122.1 cytochrome B [Halomonas rituensis]
MQRFFVWDIPVRVFHWGMVICVILSFYTMKTAGAPFLFPVETHAKAGYILLGLLFFRWVWGVVGSFHARFATFIQSPASIWRYSVSVIKGRSKPFIGHNPLGGIMVMAMLLSLTFQGVSGLFLSDDIFFQGPLYGLFGRDVSRELGSLHYWNSQLLIGLIVLHLTALVIHRLLGERLVMPMITGRKSVKEAPCDAIDQRQPGQKQNGNRWLAVTVMIIAAGLSYWLWTL